VETTQSATGAIAEAMLPLRTFDDLPARLAWFADMRESAPVLRDEASGVWHVFRYDDVDRVLGDHARFSSANGFADPEGDREGIGASMIATDPPRHRQLRGLVSLAFTPKAVRDLRPLGAMDLIADFSSPLPIAVIAEMLGVPVARLEAAIAQPMLLEQLPDLRVERNGPMPVVDSNLVFSPLTLPVRFAPS
jgi:cytochrome P450